MFKRALGDDAMHDAMHRCSVAMHDATSLCEPIVKQHPTGGHVKLHLFGNVAEAFPFGATEARLHKQLKAWGDVEKDDFHNEWLAVLRTTLRRYAPSTSAVSSESTTDDACKAHTAAAPSLCRCVALCRPSQCRRSEEPLFAKFKNRRARRRSTTRS